MPKVPRKDETDRRPRSDAVLMSLPEDRQRELFDFVDGHRADGLRKIRVMLQEEQGLTVSLATLSNWLNWYSLRAKVQGVAAMADDLADMTLQRIVVRAGLSRDLADALLRDIEGEVVFLDNLEAPLPREKAGSHFHH